MTTPTDPTTLRTALEALVQKWSDEAISAMSNGLTEQAVATEWCASDLRAVLATPAPAADEARCAFVGCGGVRDDVYHEPCLPGGVFHDHKACHPFQPDPTPAQTTPPATGTVAALVEAFVNDEMMERLALALGGAASSMTEGEFTARLDAIVAAARAEGQDECDPCCAWCHSRRLAAAAEADTLRQRVAELEGTLRALHGIASSHGARTGHDLSCTAADCYVLASLAIRAALTPTTDR